MCGKDGTCGVVVSQVLENRLLRQGPVAMKSRNKAGDGCDAVMTCVAACPLSLGFCACVVKKGLARERSRKYLKTGYFGEGLLLCNTKCEASLGRDRCSGLARTCGFESDEKAGDLKEQWVRGLGRKRKKLCSRMRTELSSLPEWGFARRMTRRIDGPPTPKYRLRFRQRVDVADLQVVFRIALRRESDQIIACGLSSRVLRSRWARRSRGDCLRDRRGRNPSCGNPSLRAGDWA